MTEYIAREALIAEFKRLTLGENGLIERVFADGVYAVLETFPAADVAPVVRGRWVVSNEHINVIDMDVVKYKCSVCEEYRLSANKLSYATKYCPNCGAKMEVGK